MTISTPTLVDVADHETMCKLLSLERQTLAVMEQGEAELATMVRADLKWQMWQTATQRRILQETRVRGIENTMRDGLMRDYLGAHDD